MSYRAVDLFIMGMLEHIGIYRFSVDQCCYSFFLQVVDKKACCCGLFIFFTKMFMQMFETWNKH